MYVVTDPQLIQSIQKDPQNPACPPIEAKFASTICGTSPTTQAILENVNGAEGDRGLSMESYAAMREGLKSGPDLDRMNRAMIHELATALDSLADVSNTSEGFPLYAWFQDMLTRATTNSVYGPKKPYKDPAVAAAFW